MLPSVIAKNPWDTRGDSEAVSLYPFISKSRTFPQTGLTKYYNNFAQDFALSGLLDLLCLENSHWYLYPLLCIFNKSASAGCLLLCDTVYYTMSLQVCFWLKCCTKVVTALRQRLQWLILTALIKSWSPHKHSVPGEKWKDDLLCRFC